VSKQKEPAPQKRIRCAIYTRKSTSEGLEAEFNTLDAQRLAAENYIASQKGEGWVALPDEYDDGGFTGGNMDRPALQRLMQDIEAGKVDCIVVYKVDRLSRSLLDFARIINTLNEHNCSFVSVTQNFSTADSMGRLTLNILLSFAQFEREIIAERTRDKMSAARKQGRWVGGAQVLGYDVHPNGGKLVVNEKEAIIVREIYSCYIELESLMPVVRVLRDKGVTNKTWTTKKNTVHQGKPFNKNALYNLLTNPLYIGKVRHKKEVYEGQHDPIVDESIWHCVQNILKRNRLNNGSTVRNTQGALLKGLLFCGSCKVAMVHTWTKKKNNCRYRYYVCGRAQKEGWDVCPVKSIPAAEIERYVVEEIRRIGKDEGLVEETFEAVGAVANRQADELAEEEERLREQLIQCTEKLQRIAGNNKTPPKTLAALQDRIVELEQEITQTRQKVMLLQREMIDRTDVARTLSLFDPVWQHLTSHEQVKALNLLIEKIVYDAETSSVAITFRETGIRDLLDSQAIDTEDETAQEDNHA